MTRNYLWLMLNHLCDPTQPAGLLVHCVSGALLARLAATLVTLAAMVFAIYCRLGPDATVRLTAAPLALVSPLLVTSCVTTNGACASLAVHRADGEVHSSLSAQQIVYLTVAYDWMLFG